MGFEKFEKHRRGTERLHYPAVSLYAGGWLYFNREAIKLFGEAEYLELFIDQERRAIGLLPTTDQKEFKFCPYGGDKRRLGRGISLMGVLTALGISKPFKFVAELKREGDICVFEIPEEAKDADNA